MKGRYSSQQRRRVENMAVINEQVPYFDFDGLSCAESTLRCLIERGVIDAPMDTVRMLTGLHGGALGPGGYCGWSGSLWMRSMRSLGSTPARPFSPRTRPAAASWNAAPTRWSGRWRPSLGSWSGRGLLKSKENTEKAGCISTRLFLFGKRFEMKKNDSRKCYHSGEM